MLHFRSVAATIRENLEGGQGAAIYISHDKRPVVDWSENGPESLMQIMSVTKSVAALALGCPEISAHVPDLDASLARTAPQQFSALPPAITLRHVLEQTSALSLGDGSEIEQVYAADDVYALALSARPKDTSGRTWSYSNSTVNLLSGVVASYTDRPYHEAVKDNLLAPLNISRFSWDSDKIGNSHLMAGLSLRVADLGRIGELILDEGRAGDKTIVHREWIKKMFIPCEVRSHYTLLWWLGWDTQDWPEPTKKAVATTLWSQGYGGQYVFVSPVAKVVVAILHHVQDDIEPKDPAVGAIQEAVTQLIDTALRL